MNKDLSLTFESLGTPQGMGSDMYQRTIAAKQQAHDDETNASVYT